MLWLTRTEKVHRMMIQCVIIDLEQTRREGPNEFWEINIQRLKEFVHNVKEIIQTNEWQRSFSHARRDEVTVIIQQRFIQIRRPSARSGEDPDDVINVDISISTEKHLIHTPQTHPKRKAHNPRDKLEDIVNTKGKGEVFAEENGVKPPREDFRGPEEQSP